LNTRYDLPDNYYFGGGGDTFIVPMALACLILAILMVVFLPRRRLIAVLLGAGVLLPFGITIVISGLHLPAFRLLIGAVWLRLAIRRELAVPKLTSIDRLFLLYSISYSVCYCIHWGTLGAVTNRLGFLWNSLGGYFLARALIRNKEDVLFTIRTLAYMTLIIAPAVAYEHLTRFNVFSILGAPPFADVRNGMIRAKGPFAHAIIAGTVGAMLAPLFVGLWLQGKKDRLLAGLAVLSSSILAVSSASSTPLMTLAAGFAALMFWRLRGNMRLLRWAVVVGIIVLQIFMKAPVWFLISRISGGIGGSGYHRAMLIDNFIRHFDEWWLFGTRNNVMWGYDMWDVDDIYVDAGIGGGLISFTLLIALIVQIFKRIGKSRVIAHKAHEEEPLIWTIGACVFANTMGFFGIVYFDQSILVWYCVLAMVSASAVFVANSKAVPQGIRGIGVLQKQTERSIAVSPFYGSRVTQ